LRQQVDYYMVARPRDGLVCSRAPHLFGTNPKLQLNAIVEALYPVFRLDGRVNHV